MAAGKQDAIALLKADHPKVAELSAAFDNAQVEHDCAKVLIEEIGDG